MIWRVLLCWLIAAPALAETVMASRSIRAHSIITETDVVLSAAKMSNGYSRIADVVGQEARVVLYAGRPILLDEIGPPALVTRNQIVRVQFHGNGLHIVTEGRVLERGAEGDRVRLMNLSSRATLFGRVMADGSIQVHR